MIRIAIQAKGRLNEQSVELLREIGIDAPDSKRKLLSRSAQFPLEILYLRDDDIPHAVQNGIADIGIVGYNEVAEQRADVQVVERLGFGGCRISLALPKAEVYEGVQWFAGRSVATSYPNILADFFERQGVKGVRIVEIKGSVEVAPAVGMADAIFDIVSSGGTLISNGLKEVERVIESEAVLIASNCLGAEQQALLDQLLFRIRSVEGSRGKKYILLNIPTARIAEAAAVLPGMKSPTVLPLAEEGWSSLHAVVDESELWALIERLKTVGAEDILVLTLDNMIR